MTTPTERMAPSARTSRPWRSGFCEADNCGLCRRDAQTPGGNLSCACECHDPQQPHVEAARTPQHVKPTRSLRCAQCGTPQLTGGAGGLCAACANLGQPTLFEAPQTASERVRRG